MMMITFESKTMKHSWERSSLKTVLVKSDSRTMQHVLQLFLQPLPNNFRHTSIKQYQTNINYPTTVKVVSGNKTHTVFNYIVKVPKSRSWQSKRSDETRMQTRRGELIDTDIVLIFSGKLVKGKRLFSER